MKKVLKSLICVVLCLASFLPAGRAIDLNGGDLLSLVNLTQETATPAHITAILGKPLRVEENKKKTTWYYSQGNSDMVISWSNKAELLKVSFKHIEQTKGVLDMRLPGQLKSGSTDMGQALRLLGTPNDITIKEKTQEMHYAYQQKVLRLFFRGRVLVDYCLY
jgi:Lhr-like helicase